MKNNEELTVRDEPASLLEVISRAVADPRMDVGKMRELFQLQREILAEQRRIEFDEAMNRLQAKLPQIPKYGQGKNSKYAKYEDVDVIVRPMLAEEGFSLSFNEEARTDTTVTFALEVSRGGHSKIHRLTVQTDRAAQNRDGRAIRPAIQDDGSTASYARRYLVKLALNIIEVGEDTDGEPLKPITAEQAKDIETMVDTIRSQVKPENRDAVLPRFLAAMQVDAISNILARDFKKAITLLDGKQRQRNDHP